MRIIVAALCLYLAGCTLYSSPLLQRSNYAEKMAQMSHDELSEYHLRDVADAFFWANLKRDVDASSLRQYLEDHAKTVTDSDWSAIEKGNIRTGMSRTAVIMSWGQPTKINTHCYKDGCDEQWVYRYNSTRYVYFRSDEVSSYSY